MAIRFTEKAPALHRSLLSRAAAALDNPRLTAKDVAAITKRVAEMRKVGREKGWND